MERGERAVAAMIGIRTAHPQPAKQIGFVRTGINPGSIVEYFADGNSATQQLVARRLNVRDDQVEALRRTGRRRRNVLAEDDRASRTRRGELDHPKVFAVVVVGVEPPSQLGVELLGAVYIRNGNDNDLEFHVECRGLGVTGRFVRNNCRGAHGSLLVGVRTIRRASKPYATPGRRSRTAGF